LSTIDDLEEDALRKDTLLRYNKEKTKKNVYINMIKTLNREREKERKKERKKVRK